jgi:hypothetical protein
VHDKGERLPGMSELEVHETLEHDSRYLGRAFTVCNPVEFLAMIATDDLFHEFHDKMGGSISISRLVKRSLFSEDKPNYREIERVLRTAGFLSIDKIRM